MKTKKINLASMKNTLSRDEMKKIFGGDESLPGGCPGIIECPTLEIGEACPDVGDSKDCTCRLHGGDHVCNP